MPNKNIQKEFISVVIPLYNEEDRLGNLLQIYKYFKKSGVRFEIILVNDGSTDKTLKKLKKIILKVNTRIISYSKNKGKGFAIKKGVAVARGNYILFTDIDLSTPIEEFNKFLNLLKTNEILIGSRRAGNSKINKRQPFLRENLGRVYTFLSSLILNLNVSDFTCGFKCFPSDVARKIFKKQKIERWGFDPEVLFLAKRQGFKIKEIPVEWSNDPRSKVSLPRDIIQSLIDLYKIRYYTFKSFY